MKAPIILRVFKDKQLIEVKQFDVDQVVVGHDADVQLELKGEGVSNIHCLIELRDNGYYVCDLGSQTGTFKNGQAILDESLASGDEVRVGIYRLVFYAGVPKPVHAPGAAAPAPVAPVAPTQTAKPSIPASSPAVETPKAAAKPEPAKPAAPAAQPVQRPKVATNTSAKPEIRATGTPVGRKHTATFAPASDVKDLKSTLQPGKGNVVEVIVAWHERVLETYHFRNAGNYKLGTTDRDAIRVPAEAIPKNWTLVEVAGVVKVNVSGAMKFELVSQSQGSRTMDDCIGSGKAVRNATGTSVRLEQGELICLSLGDINLFVRFAPRTALVPLLPALGLTGSEVSGLIMSIVLTALLAFYISATTPKDLNETPQEQITHTAQVIFNTPPPKPPTPEQTPVQAPPPTPATSPPVQVKVADESKESQHKGTQPTKDAAQKAQKAGQAAEVAPIPNSKNKPKKFTSTKQGGAIKIADKAGANANSAKDMSKVGLFSAFGGGGVRKQLDQAYAGAGEVLGQADKATGATGFGENRPGDDLGSKFKDTGAGGKGTATQGIAGIGTKGRGSGQAAYGATDGLGGKSSVAIEAGGNEADFVGTIDREAVRRVVKHYLNEIRGCYVRELNRLEKGQRLEGKVVVSWEIVAQGAAKNVKIKSSSLGNEAVENCIRERLASWIFPNPPAGTVAEVAYPFQFNQQQ